MKFKIKFLFLIFGLLILANAASAVNQSEQLLQQMIDELQQPPKDNTLREQIIRLALTLTPSPVLLDAAVTDPAIMSDVKRPIATLESGIEKANLPDMILIKGGCFMMGDNFGGGDSDENPVHEVCVDDFSLGEHEVTQAEWKKVMGSNPSFYSSCGDDCPVEKVSWDDIQLFFTKLNQQTTPTILLNKEGQKVLYRLPTEAEWEYAARSGGKRDKWAGTNIESQLGNYGWYARNSESKTHPIKQKKPNGLGLYDMSGNVYEWVSDWYGDKYYSSSPKDNPKGTSTGDSRVVRGGSWYLTPDHVRSSNCGSLTPAGRFIYLGFRCAAGQAIP